MKYIFYRFVRILIRIINKLIFRVECIGRDNIPEKGRVILVGNHTHIYDALLVIGCPKRIVHTVAKKELFKNIFGRILFKSMACIPVDRKNHNDNIKEDVIKILEKEEVVTIFPEGTVNKTKKELLPFKYGAVSFANKTSSYIVPFAINGKYKFFKKGIKIIYGKPYKLKSNDLEKENKILENKVLELKGKVI